MNKNLLSHADTHIHLYHSIIAFVPCLFVLSLRSVVQLFSQFWYMRKKRNAHKCTISLMNMHEAKQCVKALSAPPIFPYRIVTFFSAIHLRCTMYTVFSNSLRPSITHKIYLLICETCPLWRTTKQKKSTKNICRTTIFFERGRYFVVLRFSFYVYQEKKYTYFSRSTLTYKQKPMKRRERAREKISFHFVFPFNMPFIVMPFIHLNISL